MHKDVSFNVTAMALGTVPEHKRRVPTAIIVVDSSSGNKTLIFHDVFTPDSSNGTASPTAQTRTFFKIETGGGPVNLTYGVNELAGIELFGAGDVSCNVSDVSGNVHFAFKDV